MLEPRPLALPLRAVAAVAGPSCMHGSRSEGRLTPASELLPRVSPRVCASGKPGKSKDLDITAVPHGFRSSFRDRMAEETDHPREVIETALAHVVRHNVEATDARSDLFGRRRPLDGPLGRLPRRLTAGAGVSVEVRRRFETELDGADGKMRGPRRWPGRREHRRSGDPPSTLGPRAARGPPPEPIQPPISHSRIGG